MSKNLTSVQTTSIIGAVAAVLTMILLIVRSRRES